MKIIPYMILFTLLGSSASIKKECFVEQLKGKKFRYYNTQYLSVKTNNASFEIDSNFQSEYLNGKLFARSSIKWVSCNSYLLKFQEVNSVSFKKGDSILVKIIDRNADTFTYEATFFDTTIISKYYISNK